MRARRTSCVRLMQAAELFPGSLTSVMGAQHTVAWSMRETGHPSGSGSHHSNRVSFRQNQAPVSPPGSGSDVGGPVTHYLLLPPPPLLVCRYLLHHISAPHLGYFSQESTRTEEEKKTLRIFFILLTSPLTFNWHFRPLKKMYLDGGGELQRTLQLCYTT